MKEYIKNVLVEYHKTCTTDKYGQVHISNFTKSLFGERKEEVKEFCDKNKGILRFSTYGASYGTYVAFTIEDVEIRKACSEALSTNPNYKSNVNSW